MINTENFHGFLVFYLAANIYGKWLTSHRNSLLQEAATANVFLSMNICYNSNHESFPFKCFVEYSVAQEITMDMYVHTYLHNIRRSHIKA